MNYRIVFPHSLLPQNGFHAPMPCIVPFSSVIFTEPYQLFICIFIKEQVVCTLVLDIKEEGESFGTGPSGSLFFVGSMVSIRSAYRYGFHDFRLFGQVRQ